MEYCRIESLDEACQWTLSTFKSHPERNQLESYLAALDGRKRRYPALQLNHLANPADDSTAIDDFMLPHLVINDRNEASLAALAINRMAPLAMLNPVSLALPLGVGPGTLAASFGIELDPSCAWSPAHSISLDKALALGAIDPENSGMLPEIKAKIELYKKTFPPEFLIQLPDIQGPFNIAHAVLGDEAFFAPVDEPERFAEFMSRITDFWIQVRHNLLSWIGSERIYPFHQRLCRITECSVNLISAEMYRIHVLPHDLRITNEFGNIHIHPCRGPHVFHVTLDNLPGIKAIETGYIANSAAGAILVEESLAAIANRDIWLMIGQEVPSGAEFEFIVNDLNYYEQTQRLTYIYTCMGLKKKDRPFIRDLHRRLDDYWMQKFVD